MERSTLYTPSLPKYETSIVLYRHGVKYIIYPLPSSSTKQVKFYTDMERSTLYTPSLPKYETSIVLYRHGAKYIIYPLPPQVRNKYSSIQTWSEVHYIPPPSSSTKQVKFYTDME